jgi:hypothetical protein
MTLYTYNSYHKDIRWCLQAAAQSRSILINLGLSNHIELLKGYLLSLPQAYAYGGDCEFARARMHDMSIWITKIAGEPGDRINYIQEVINE